MPKYGTATDQFTDAEIHRTLERCGGSKKLTAETLGVTRNQLNYRLQVIDEARPPIKRALITAAQNNTPVDEALWRTLTILADDCGATLHVIPYRYLNPSLATIGKQEPVWYDARIVRHLCDETVDLSESIKIAGDVPVQATAVRPLSSLEDLTQGKTMVIGHGQIAVQPVPRPVSQSPIWLIASGAVTQSNYSSSKAGARARFHHCPGAVLIETQGPYWWCHQLYAEDDGSVSWLGKRYTPRGITEIERALALVTGDEHAIQMSSDVRQATYGKGGIVETLRPEFIVRHDVLDFLAESHHERDNPSSYAKAISGVDDVEAELEFTLAHIEQTTPADSMSVIVDSNHNRHLDRWLKDKPAQPKNRKLWHQLQAAVLAASEDNRHVNAFHEWAKIRGYDKDRILFIGPRDDFSLAGVDLTMHGDSGLNGSRGSIYQFARASQRCIVGHSHAPAIHHGAMQVGMSTDEPDYVGRLSNNDQCHAVIYPGGKRSLLPIRNGRWRA